jgi:hypothetical protein
MGWPQNPANPKKIGNFLNLHFSSADLTSFLPGSRIFPGHMNQSWGVEEILRAGRVLPTERADAYVQRNDQPGNSL